MVRGSNATKAKVYGGIETGGTKFVCAVGTGPEDLTTTQFATAIPDESIGKAIDFFKCNGCTWLSLQLTGSTQSLKTP
jgi:hypothetical protein